MGGNAAGEEAPCALMQRWFRDVAPDIGQPPLRENLLAMHLGVSKRVTRLQGRNREVHDVEQGLITVIPALTPGRWSTQGPVDFAHLTPSPGLLRQVAVEEFDRDPRDLRLLDHIGHRDPVIEACFGAPLRDLERLRPGHLDRESLLSAISFNLVRQRSTLSPTLRPSMRASGAHLAEGGLAGRQTRRVVDHMHACRSISVDGELVQLTGLSRARFFRAFERSAGRSPGACLTELRVRQAGHLLAATDMPLAAVAAAVGLGAAQRADSVRRSVGTSPAAHRRARSRLP